MIDNVNNLPAISSKNGVRNLSIARLHLSGMSQSEIAEKVGLSQVQISNILKDDNIKAVINDTIKGMVLAAPQIGNKLIAHCLDEDDKGISVKAISEYNKAIGIVGTHANVYVNNLMVSNQTLNVLSDEMGSLLASRRIDRPQDAEVIDIEVE